MSIVSSSFVTITGEHVSVSADNVAEAKLALKELKLHKKSYAAKKKEIAIQMQGVRAQYTDEVRTRGSMVRGGGGFGRFIRLFQTGSRDSTRRALAEALRPLESQKQQIEAILVGIDQAAVQIEAYVLRNGE